GAFGGLFGAMPELGGEQVEHDVVVVVVAVETEGLPKRGIVRGVPRPADHREAVGAGAGSVTAGVAGVGAAVAAFPVAAGVCGDAAGVDGAEAGGGEGVEDGRMRGDRIRDAFAADESGAQELVGVLLVGAGAGR